MPWTVDGKTKPGVLQLRLHGSLDERAMAEFLRAHNTAIDAYNGAEYRVFCDIRGLKPMALEAAAHMESAKQYSYAHKNFQGSAVLVDGQVAALQHQRTSVSSGVITMELITDDEKACWDHIAVVRRNPG